MSTRLVAAGLALVSSTTGIGGAALAQTLFSSDLERDHGRPLAASVAQGSDGVAATAAIAGGGTIDRYMGAPGQALVLTYQVAPAAAAARAAIVTPPLPVANRETALGLLTVSADLFVDDRRPVRLRIASLDAGGGETGARTALLYPPAANAWVRQSIDLDHTAAAGGRFDPRAPRVRLSFELADADGPTPLPRDGRHALRIDNISYAAPSLYVAPTGRDRADGRSPDHAVATIQRAVDLAGPGDTIVLMKGTYRVAPRIDASDATKAAQNGPLWRPWWVLASGSTVAIDKPGRPDRWITLRGMPGESPIIFARGGWEAIRVGLNAAYLEIRGLTLRGDAPRIDRAAALADSEITLKGDTRYYGDPLYNTNGITADGRKATDPARRAHHLRLIGNDVGDFPGAGLSVIASDHVTIQGNVVHDNVHLTRWGSSGISFLRSTDWDGSRAHKMFILGNRAFDNRTYVPWIRYQNDASGKPVSMGPQSLSDGNGIIVDVSRHTGESKDGFTDADYGGRTLVANNESFGNGGGGIVLTTVLHVDVVNNTLYGNVQTPDLAAKGWGDLFIGGGAPSSGDVTAVDNIVVATAATNALTIHRLTKPQPVLVRRNLFHGGAVQPTDQPQVENTDADPVFRHPSLDGSADLRPAVGSPAIGISLTASVPPTPLIDMAGIPRDPKKPTLGAHEPR